MIASIIAVLSGGVMIGAMVIGKKRRAPWCKPVAGVAGVMATISALASVVIQLNSRSEPDVVIPLSATYDQVRAAGHVLGSHLANVAKQNILVIGNAQADMNATQQFADAVAKAINLPHVKVVTETMSLETAAADPKITPDVAAMEKVKTLMALHRDCSIVIATVPIPSALFEYVWEKRADAKAKVFPQFVLCNVDLKGLEPILEADIVIAAVTGNPRPQVYTQPTTAAPLAPEALFETNFILIHKDNFGALKTQYPELF